MSQSAASILTTARRAFWDAIDNHGPLQSTLKQKYRMESTARARGSLEPSHDKREPTSIIDCPAIRVRPVSFGTEWKLNQLQRLPYALEWKVWSAGQDVAKIEELVGLVIDAVHQSKAADAADSYIRSALPGQIPVFGPIAFGLEGIDDGSPDNEQQPVLTATGVLTLPLNYQPVNYNVE